MVSDSDIYRSVRFLIDQHGEDAARHAAMCANTFLEAGDMEGQAVWLRVLSAIRVFADCLPLQRHCGGTRLLHRGRGNCLGLRAIVPDKCIDGEALQ